MTIAVEHVRFPASCEEDLRSAEELPMIRPGLGPRVGSMDRSRAAFAHLRCAGMTLCFGLISTVAPQ